ncbi:MAG: Xaa-Pro peptidase family protein [Chloroflexota bacterium]
MIEAVPTIPAIRHVERLAAAQAIVAERGLAAALIGVGADLQYLSGYRALPLERLTMLVIPAIGRISLVVPRLEAPGAHRCSIVQDRRADVVPWDETDTPADLVAERLATVGLRRPAAGDRIGISERLWAMHLLALQAALPGVQFESATAALSEIRMIKDADEIAILRTAAHAADRVVEQIARGRLVGRTEGDVSREVRERLLAEGHDTAEFAIVASGPNSASPHHEASERIIRAGEPIVLDIGGLLNGYASDTTRTLWVTGGDPAHGPDADFLRLFGLVREAQAAATAAVAPGVPCERVDAVAREVITAGGEGPQFIHRVGHGIGLETHEDPYLVAGNAQPLRAGMAFSIEPGIYRDGRYGSRIEDIVVCGADGPDALNRSDHDLWVVDG